MIEEELFVMGRGKQTTVEMVGAKSVNIKQRFVSPESVYLMHFYVHFLSFFRTVFLFSSVSKSLYVKK